MYYYWPLGQTQTRTPQRDQRVAKHTWVTKWKSVSQAYLSLNCRVFGIDVTLTSALRALFSSQFCSWHILDVTKQLHLKQSIRRTLRIYTLSNTQACSYHLSDDLQPSWGLLCLSHQPYHPYELMWYDNNNVVLETEEWPLRKQSLFMSFGSSDSRTMA